MKSLFLSCLLCSTTLLANELPQRIYEVLGSYESESAMNSDSYYAQDLSQFKLLVTPESEAMVHFEDWDIEIKLDKELEFYQSDISECQDPSCGGVSDIEGKISFKNIDGKEIPVATVTMHFYQDTSEDVDCDEVDCDNLEYEDYWKEWSETYEFKFTGSFDGQLPSFKPVALDSDYATVINECKELAENGFVHCVEAQQFSFVEEVNEANLIKLQDFLYTGMKISLQKATALKMIESTLVHKLLLLKTYKFDGVETEAFLSIKENAFKMLELMKNTDADNILTGHTRNYSWRDGPTLDFLFINKLEKKVTRFKMQL